MVENLQAEATEKLEPTRGNAQLRPTVNLRQLELELDALRREIASLRGEDDANHIRDVIAAQRGCELGGRVLLNLGWLPPAWLLGTGLLTLAKILENMEIGHNVIHGQYDFLNDPQLFGQRYEWDWICTADSWRRTHNLVHHTYTNIVGQDRDIGYGVLRMADEQPWHLYNVPQPVYAAIQALLFEWAVAVHDLEFDEFLHGRKPLSDVIKRLRPLVKKAGRQLFKDYLLFPALAGPGAPVVFAGNLTANLLRNLWAFSVIVCGHFPQEVQMHPMPCPDSDTRGAWYLRQILGSANIEGPAWLHVLTGHLSYQIEHHLFPDLPSFRYPEIGARVRQICAEHGVAYNTGPLGRQLASAWTRIVRCALPLPQKRAVQDQVA